MFVYQDDKLYIEDEGTLVGVNVNSHGVSKVSGETASYHDGLMLTNFEVHCKFGTEYKFPATEVQDGQVGNDENPAKPKRGRPRRSV